MPFCRNCGLEVEQEERFCANCGIPQEEVGLLNHERPKASSSRKPAVHILIIFLALITIGGGIAAFLILPDNNFTIWDASNKVEETEPKYNQEPDSETPLGKEIIIVPDDFLTIQEALDSVPDGTTIVVSKGTYYENIDFMGKEVILQSIEPTNPEVVKNTIIHGNNNGSVVSFLNGEGNGARLDGFTIRGGSGTELSFIVSYLGERQNYNRIYGGGIIISGNSSPQITNNIIEDNMVRTARRGVFGVGAGIAVLDHSNPLIENNTIKSNDAEGYAGGVAIWYRSAPQLLNNTIEGNVSEDIAGGILVAMECSPTIIGNYISNNSSHTSGGLYIAHRSSGLISDNTIYANSSNIGAGILVWGTGDVDISDNHLELNEAKYYGGGLFVGNESTATVTGNVFKDNKAHNKGAAIWVAEGSRLNLMSPHSNSYSNNIPDNIVYSTTAGPSGLPWP